ncbi:hypothetical protein PAHAL_3G281000 [Panicum hallii]|uniref:Uncharacterized protein n=1 Tax=Panicum hallii TaxID=206008 RepID=A0A2S3HC25_9POAL|nr:hypothetical protein PAHAL_3G281000 [Panicum hallii]
MDAFRFGAGHCNALLAFVPATRPSRTGGPFGRLSSATPGNGNGQAPSPVGFRPTWRRNGRHGRAGGGRTRSLHLARELHSGRRWPP